MDESSCCKAFIAGGSAGPLRWLICSDGTLTISGNGAMPDYTTGTAVPWAGYRNSFTVLVIDPGVTHIGNYAFTGCGFTSLTIPNTISSIGEYAFYNNSRLKDLTIEDGTTILSLRGPSYGNSSSWFGIFSGCPIETLYWGRNIYAGNMSNNIRPNFGTSLKEATIGNNVTSIGSYAFNGCSNLASITISASVTSIGYEAFRGCSNLANITIPAFVTTIGSYAFYGCKSLTSITIPASITTVGSWAFHDCSNLSEIINHAITPQTINANVFSVPISSRTLHVPVGSVEAYRASAVWRDFGCIVSMDESGCCENFIAGGSAGTLGWILCQNGTLTISGNGAMPDYNNHNTNGSTAPWAVHRNSFTALVIEPGVTHIGNYAFNGCKSFTGSMTLPEGLKSIGQNAFDGCIGFSGSLSLPEGIESIGHMAFWGCCDITGDMTFPESLTNIGNGAFGGCNCETIRDSGSSGNIRWTLCEDGTLTIYGTGTMLNYLYDATNGSTAPWASYRDSFTALVIEPGVTSIGSYAFYGCSNFTGNLTLPEGLTTIGQSAFWDCSGFTGSLTFPSSLANIGNYVFQNCNGFSEVINHSITPQAIANVFSSSFPRSAMTLRVSVGSVEAYQADANWRVFGCIVAINESGCCETLVAGGSAGSLRWVICSDGTLTISGTGAMPNYSYNATNGSTAPWARYRDSFTTLVIEDGVTSIGNYAFYGCNYFTGNLILPEQLTSIGDYAFYNCNGFTNNLILPAKLTSIGQNSFYGCSGFTGSMTLPEEITNIGFSAFSGCIGFTEVINHATTPQTINANVFSGIPINAYTLRVNAGSKDAYNSSAVWRDFGCIVAMDESGCCENFIAGGSFGSLRWILCPNGTLTISGNGEMLNSGLSWSIREYTTAVVIEEGVTSIGSNVFSWFSNLTSATIPASVATIGNNPFYGCSSLSSIHVDANSTYLSSENGVLFNRDKTTLIQYPAGKDSENYDIPVSVITIGDYAFSECNNLTSVIIPTSVVTIGDNAFISCSKLTSVAIPASVIIIGEGAFISCSSLKSVIVPASASLTTIERLAFAYCESLTSINIPSSVTTIGDYAFQMCSNLTTVVSYAKTPPILGWDVFSEILSYSPFYSPKIS